MHTFGEHGGLSGGIVCPSLERTATSLPRNQFRGFVYKVYYNYCCDIILGKHEIFAYVYYTK